MSAAGTNEDVASRAVSRPSWTKRMRRLLIGSGAVTPLAIAHALAAAGDAFVSVSLAGSLFFNVSPNASREQVLLYLVITMAPLAVLSPLVGPAIDRFAQSQRYVAAGFYVARGVLCLALALTLLQLAFYPIVLGVLILSKASGVVKQTLVQTLVDDPDELVATNARLARFATITAGIGVIAATGVYSSLGAEWSLRGGAVLLAVAGAVVLRARPQRQTHVASGDVEYAEAHLPLVIVSSIGMLAIRAAVGFFLFTLAFTLRKSSEPAVVYGLGAAFYGAGSFAGHTAATVLRRRFREARLIALAIAMPAVFAAVGVLGASVPLLMVLSALVGLSTTLGRNAFDGQLQRRAPEALLGRAGARFETRFQLAWVFGGVLATPIALPPEVSMMVLTAMYVPALFIVWRGSAEAYRFEDISKDHLGGAWVRLASAQQAWDSGEGRVAIIDASAAVDLVQTVTGPLESALRSELDDLRARALDIAAPVGEDQVLKALALADQVISEASSS